MKRSFAVPLLALMVLLSACGEKASLYSNDLRTDVFQQKYNDQSYDFLWLFDTSTSMAPRRQALLNDMQNFLNILTTKKALDFQWAVTTINMFTTKGNLIANPSGLNVVKSATSSNPVSDFTSIVNNMPSSDPSSPNYSSLEAATSFWEQGLESSYQAITNHGTQFMRNGVPLIVILMSDEDDYSCAGNCYGVEPEHNDTWIPFSMDRYVNLYNTVKASQSTTASFFAITGLDYNTCPVPTVGSRYIQLINDLGSLGSAQSVCDNELISSFENIARNIADRGTTFALSQKASGQGITVYVNNVVVPSSPDNYVFDTTQNAIVFTGAIPPNGASIVVVYNQMTN